MQITSLIFGIISLLGMCFGFVPCFGMLNWINIPLSFVGVIIAIIAIVTNKGEEDNNKAIAGLVMCILAICLGTVRLVMGGGVV